MSEPQELEMLISGKVNRLEFSNSSREQLLEKLNHLLLTLLPNASTSGNFLDSEGDYLVYDLQITSEKSNFFIRMVELSDFIKLIRY